MVLKDLILTVSILEGCGCLERTDFLQFLLWKGMVVLKDLIFTASTLGGCGGQTTILSQRRSQMTIYIKFYF